jgi:hypothetical protein
MKVGQGEMEETRFGAMRESNKGRGRFDLLPFEAMEALAIWYEEGAAKYDDRNWEKGISVKDCINRMIRHAIKAGNGWTDEDHLAAVMWNAAAAITMIRRKPECNDHHWVGLEAVESPISEIDNSKTYWERMEEGITKDKNKNIVADEDKFFLIKALESGGISDIETLTAWLGRRSQE